ncbi:MAG: NAD(P)H-binding protein [Nevskiaceae bacterium]|nr:NAD(P)H-binding protein [Nevskiaceae bacterium]
MSAALMGASAPASAQTKAAKPLKIVVYGGSGAIGSRIVNEAAARGHQVTVVDRSPKPELAPQGVRVVQGDALDAQDIGKNIVGQDAVISSVIVRPAPTADFSLKIAQAMVAAQRAQQGANKTRFLMVGGASSLFDAQGKRLIDNARQPVAFEVSGAVAALDWLLTVKDVPWTFFSPPQRISAGTRTGKYRRGGDQLVVDDQGRSAISMEDYAVAMIDEIENPQSVNKRFTAAY